MRYKLRFFSVFLLFLVPCKVQTAPVDHAVAHKVAISFLAENRINLSVDSCSHVELRVKGSNFPLAFVFKGAARGFIVVAADDRLDPVISFDTHSFFTENSPLYSMIMADLDLRLTHSEKQTISAKQKIGDDWNRLKLGTCKALVYDQWPPEGTTSTGGWTVTKWNQNAPYNKFCPIKLSSGQRSLTGCPATAMAQIVNYLRKINSTRFNITDKYYHSYTQNFWIDDTWSTYDYLSFDSLNVYLDSIENKFSLNIDLSTDEIAALSLATGFACKSVYDPAGSGTFSVTQAFDAYKRFGFTQAVLLGANFSDEEIRQKIISNIKAALPVHLAVVDPNWQSGHNVVCDGYRDNGFFRLNMGWGGSYDNWYSLPEGFPFSLTVFEGIVADIMAPQSYTVSFYVTGFEQTAVEGAAIAIETIADQLYTNPDGFVSLELPNGSYSYTVEASGYQSISSNFSVNNQSLDIVVSMIPVSIEINNSPNINVYPNPFNQSLTISNTSRICKASLINARGQNVFEEFNVGCEQLSISVNELPSGTYVLVIISDTGERIAKLIVK